MDDSGCPSYSTDLGLECLRQLDVAVSKFFFSHTMRQSEEYRNSTITVFVSSSKISSIAQCLTVLLSTCLRNETFFSFCEHAFSRPRVGHLYFRPIFLLFPLSLNTKCAQIWRNRLQFLLICIYVVLAYLLSRKSRK